MANSKLIIVEGAQGVGKTTVTDYIRQALPYTSLYRLSGTSDPTLEGKKKATQMYFNLNSYLQSMQNLNINLLFDRTFFSEENYCRLEKKDYSFTDVYTELVKTLNLLDFDIYYITLYLEDTSKFETRLKRDKKCEPAYAKFKTQSSIEQQRVYLEMADELATLAKNIKVFKVNTDVSTTEVFEQINEILNISI